MMEKQVIIQGLNIRYFQSDELEKKQVVVFLHGWGSQSAHMRNIFEDLPNFIALDLPGFGRSDLPPAPWGVTEYADFLESFIKKIELTNLVLVGHSFGGSVIVKYLSGGAVAKKVILIDSSGIRKRGLKIFLYKIIAKIFKLFFLLPGLHSFKDGIRKKFYGAIDSVDYIEAGKMTESYRKIICEDLTGDLSKVKTETVLIWGEKDQDTPIWQARLMQENIIGSKLFIIPDAGHFSFIDEPEKFKEIFLKEI